jgi:hypothetical protein
MASIEIIQRQSQLPLKFLCLDLGSFAQWSRQKTHCATNQPHLLTAGLQTIRAIGCRQCARSGGGEYSS